MKLLNKLKYFIILAIIFTLAGCFYIFAEKNGLGRSTDIKAINIPAGSYGSQIVKILKENKIIGNEKMFSNYIAKSGVATKFIAGNHNLSGNMSYEKVARLLMQQPDISGIKVTIPEGYEIRQIADLLVANGLIDRKKFMKEVEDANFEFDFLKGIPRKKGSEDQLVLEGYLFPATYTFETTATEREIITQMLQAFDDNYDAVCKNRQQDMGWSIDQIVILASIIEREAVGEVDRDKVSSVFHNRLNSKDMRLLQSCATVQYILKERKPVLSWADTEIVSPYNTYINPGLPVGPIANPGKASIVAALNPAKTDYFYFVYAGGQHIFSRTLDEHNAAQN